jgi:plastocyanin
VGGDFMNFKKAMVIGLISVSAVVLAGCNRQVTSEVAESGNVIVFDGNSFSPAEITVGTNETIVFRNDSSTNVSVNSDLHPTHTLYPELNLDVIEPGSSKSLQFANSGTYKYHNHLNASQGGTITVE